MITLDFDIVKSKYGYNTAIIDFPIKRGIISCLVDTGAYLAIWCSGLAEFLVKYPNSVYTNMIALVGGFGSGTNVGYVYKIPEFILSDGKNAVHYHNFIIAVIDKDFSFDLILGYSVFNTANMSINTFTNRDRVHKITPHLIVKYMRKDLYVNPVHVAQNEITSEGLTLMRNYKAEGILKTISIFSQG